MDELWRRPAGAIAELVRTGRASAREVAQAAIARLEAVNGALNAVVDWRSDEVLAEADRVDAARTAGAVLGPLAGVPVTVKVNVDQAGFATTNGLVQQKDLVAAEDGPVVANLRAAGAVILGRTNTPAFSYRWFTANRLHGETRNPHDPRLTPGGSSGGAAAAVASGIGHLAHGTDIAGSIRYPAYACGVHGLRPTLGRVAAYNATAPERDIGGQLMAVSGPLGRSMADLRLGLDALSRRDPRDPWWTPAPLEGPAAPRRVALCLAPDGLETCAEVRDALRDAGRRLEATGWQVEEFENLPPLREPAELNLLLWLGYGHEAKLAAAEIEGDAAALHVLRHARAGGAPASLDSYAAALIRRSALLREWTLFFEQHPVALMPVSGELPFENHLDSRGEAEFARVLRAQLPQVGIPFMSLPGLAVTTGRVGRTPVGVQLVAGRYREDLLLAAGEALVGDASCAVVDPA